jgi:hypothetical protein
MVGRLGPPVELLHKLFGLLLDGIAQRLVNPGEHSVGAIPGVHVGGVQVASDVADIVLLLARRSAKNVPQTLGLDKVVVADLMEQLLDGLARPLLVRDGGLDRLVGELAVRRGVSVGLG